MRSDSAFSELPGEEPAFSEPAFSEPVSAYHAPNYHYHAVQMTWLVTGILEFIIGLRLVLKLLGANPETSFVQLVNFLSWPLERLFDDIFPNAYSGNLEFESGSATALVIILALALILVAAIKILSVPRGTRLQD
jgi:hypothetical protein